MKPHFGESRSCKNAVFAILGALNFVNLVDLRLQKVQRLIKTQIQTLKIADFALCNTRIFKIDFT